MKSIDKIIDLGAVFFAVDRKVLVSRRRDDRTARIRFSIMGVLREEGYSLQAISGAFNRDHGTAIYAINNLNPDSMANLWPHHLKFLEMVKSRFDLDDEPIPDVIAASKIALADIDEKLARLTATRQILATSLAALEQQSAPKSPLPNPKSKIA